MTNLDRHRRQALILLADLRDTADGDSNDDEIAAGQDLADFVMTLFRITEDDIETERTDR